MRGVLRSAHPTHSVAALGPRARELVSAHRPDQAPLARDGFWGRLCDLGGDVLLLCPIRSATIFHAGEAWLGLPQEPLIAHALDERGQRRVHVLPNAPWHVDHFEPSLARPMLRSGRMTRTGLGESEMYLARASDMADASVRALRRDPTLCLGRGGECACHHCQALRKGLARGWRPRGVRTGAPGP
jgi:aminoglycoside 3-N-acetyltransferase